MMKWSKLLVCSLNMGYISRSSLSYKLPVRYHRRWCCSPSLSALVENLEKGWEPPKKDEATKRDPNAPIPSTLKWTINELEFFKLHYYQVNDSSLWTHVFCPSAPLTDVAKDVIGMNLSNRDIVEGNYMHLPFHLQVFAQMLFAALLPHRREPISDHLITYLLQACNPDNILLPEPGMRYTTQVGKFTYVSIPDVTVDIRMPSKPFVGSSLIIVEDKLHEGDELDANGDKVVKSLNKPDPAKNGEYQLPGEMVAAAMHNYTHEPLPQTIFALRVVGTHVTFYRADFPVHYLESIKQGEPADDITIFRFGGEYNTNNLGLLVDSKDREIVVRWICNIMAACTQIARFLRDGAVSSITTDRVATLYPLKVPKLKPAEIKE